MKNTLDNVTLKNMPVAYLKKNYFDDLKKKKKKKKKKNGITHCTSDREMDA